MKPEFFPPILRVPFTFYCTRQGPRQGDDSLTETVVSPGGMVGELTMATTARQKPAELEEQNRLPLGSPGLSLQKRT